MAFKNTASHVHNNPIGTVFDTVEDAWFWCVSAMTAKADGAQIKAGQASVPRPCEPVDIMKVVDRLYRNRAIMRDHLRVLIHYGKRCLAPDPRRNKEARAYTLWDDAMMRMESILEKKGIIYASHDSFHDYQDDDDFDVPAFLNQQGVSVS